MMTKGPNLAMQRIASNRAIYVLRFALHPVAMSGAFPGLRSLILSLIRRYGPHLRFMFFACVLFTLSLVAIAADTPPHIGVFSNMAEGFYVKRLVVIEEGKCLYQGIPGNWTRNPHTEEFTIIFPRDAELEFYTFKLRFDSVKRAFTILDPKIAEGTRPMHFVPVEIPDKVRKMLERFDGSIRSYHE